MAAAFVLGINLFVAAMFAAAFSVVALNSRNAAGAAWVAAGYGLGIANVGLEFILPLQTDPRPVSIAIYVVFLSATSAWVVGMARHYHVEPPWRTLAIIVALSTLSILVIIDMPRDNLGRAILYQLPYFAVQILGALTIYRARRRQPLDLVLLVLMVLSGLQFMAKPFIGVLVGTGASPQAYMGTTYAAISQSLGAVTLVTLGLVLLLIMMRDTNAEITARSETDILSGLLNRRGFEDHADRALSLAGRAGVPASVVVADLDHFKQINDRFGHAAGDGVIVAFAHVLRESGDPRSIVGRLGGEEFAVFVPGAHLGSARLLAETVRSAFAALPAEKLGIDSSVSASFGVAQLRSGDSLSDVMRRADAALYQAKTEGRNRVCIALNEPPRPLASAVGN